MPATETAARRATQFAAAGLLLIAVVVLVSAAIRLGTAAPPLISAGALAFLRGIHRVAASLDAVAIVALAWFAWRLRATHALAARAAVLALLLTLLLSGLGVAGGTAPGVALSLGNLLGGLALAAALAWILGRLRGQRDTAPVSRRAAIAIVLIIAQCVLGGWLAIAAHDLWSVALLLHILFGAALLIGVLRLATKRVASGQRDAAQALVLATFAAPATGTMALLFSPNFAASLAHAVAAAALVMGLAYARARFA